MIVGALALAIASVSTAQTFTGGVRGAVKDANGVIPGVTVELINEATGQARDAVSNETGEYSFAAVPPGVYTIKATLSGFKTYENTGVRVAAQQFITLDVTLEVGELQETITVTGAAPVIDTSNATGGGVISTEQMSALPSGGRSAFLFAVTLPTVVASGDPQFNRQQDQTSASLLSLGGGTRRGNNYLVDGVPVTDIRNQRLGQPHHRGAGRRGRAGAQLRRRDRPHRRRHVQRGDQVGHQQLAGSVFYQNRREWGTSNNYFSRRTTSRCPTPTTTWAAAARRPDREEPHVLLGGG
ncbi:MAG: carboxypeptidase-like regulatory domain-containing protein [Vicinamibacterales bacterium]